MYDEAELFSTLNELYNSGIKSVELMMKPSHIVRKQYGGNVPLGYPDTMGKYADKFLGKVIKCRIIPCNDMAYGDYFVIKSDSLIQWSWSHYSFYLAKEKSPIVTKLKSL